MQDTIYDTTMNNPLNPFNDKSLTIPDWATHAAQDMSNSMHNGGEWWFYNMKPALSWDGMYYEDQPDKRVGFKYSNFRYKPTAQNGVFQRYTPFKVGDTVRVKSVKTGWYKSVFVEGLSESFVEEMQQYVGKVFKVDNYRPLRGIALPTMEGTHYNYLPDWLELITPNHSELTPAELLKERQQKFKVGDKVILKGAKHGEKNLDGDAKYYASMDYYIGTVMVVTVVYTRDSDIKLKPLNGYWTYLVSPDWVTSLEDCSLDTNVVGRANEWDITDVPSAPDNTRQYSHYFKDVSNLDTIDVYKVLELFNVTNPCLQHIVKKALVTGGRTAGKDFSQDLREIRDTAIRAVEMDSEV